MLIFAHTTIADIPHQSGPQLVQCQKSVMQATNASNLKWTRIWHIQYSCSQFCNKPIYYIFTPKQDKTRVHLKSWTTVI
jgi:hypothetical protein